MLEQKKAAARENYKATRNAYLENQTKENWIRLCEAKRICRLLGVII